MYPYTIPAAALVRKAKAIHCQGRILPFLRLTRQNIKINIPAYRTASKMYNTFCNATEYKYDRQISVYLE